jgi:hypothetical protein
LHAFGWKFSANNIVAWRNHMKRSIAFGAFATVFCLGLAAGHATAQDPQCSQPAWSIRFNSGPPPVTPFVGANYSLYAPGNPYVTYGSYYQGPVSPFPYVRNYTGPGFGGRVPTDPRYPNPGPYYYTPGYAYTPGYYSYYYTPGFYRY